MHAGMIGVMAPGGAAGDLFSGEATTKAAGEILGSKERFEG